MTSFSEVHSLLTSRLIDFDDARVEIASADFFQCLVIAGIKPYANMEVRAFPRAYASRPEYWAVEVVGSLSKYAILAASPYEIVLPLDWVAGSRGLVVIGESRSKAMDWTFSRAENPDDGLKTIAIAPGRRRLG